MSHAAARTVASGRVAALAMRQLVPRLKDVSRLLPVAAETSDGNAEHVHQLRVATRRAAVAVTLFEDLLTPSQSAWWKRTLKDLRHSTNAARDDDVLTERLRQEPETRDVAQLLQRGLAHRRASQQPLVDMAHRLLASRALDDAISDVCDTLAAPAEAAPERGDLHEFVVRALKSFRERFFRASKRNLRRAARLHQFRVRTKGLRYALELVAGHLPSEELSRVLKTVEKLQDHLGRINDHHAAAERFERWEADANDPDEIAYLEANAKAERKAFRQTRNEALDWWTDRRSKRLKRRLTRMLEAQAVDSAVPQPA
jgi:CHAD domain-containing protein